jgi:hypothetical protein
LTEIYCGCQELDAAVCAPDCLFPCPCPCHDRTEDEEDEIAATVERDAREAEQDAGFDRDAV